MNKHHYEFFDGLLVEVSGSGGRTDEQFRKMYDHFRVASPGREPDIVIEETTKDVDPDVVLGDPKDYYGWTGEQFVIRNGTSFMAVTPGWDHIQVTPGFEPFYAIYPMEFEIRKRMVEEGRALVHASGVQLNGKTTLFPAWRGAGKTNTLLSLLREGANFLSDDRLWVGADGEAFGYPLGVNLQPYNIESFSEVELTHDSLKDRLRHEVHEYVDDRFGGADQLPATALLYLNGKFLSDDGRDFTDVGSLYSTAEYVERSSVDNIVFLQAAPNNRHVTSEPLSTEEAMKGITSICNFEWDGRLREYFHAYDSLVGDGAMIESLDEVIRREREVFEELFEDVGTYCARIPRERNWTEHGLDTEVVEMIDSLEPRRAVEASD
ncbi:hypothetical protein [Halogeometricum luteum]|uniref:HprK-related kinase B n=1 Tax=Halogeometricum luteum TaxID=2950537 RepID=A0ABU2G0G2_9EURY|nr:hypothetical protein [Halogeometricum sp. S3BR5-2]MDS0294275.1 hypothetical protein [Halogeometricum sp. S3BR5-2]